MYDLIKNFIIGGTIISLTTYFIQKDSNNTKYVAIFVHGLPTAFIATWLLLNKNNQQILTKNGIYLSIVLAICMGILYILGENNISNVYNLAFTGLVWSGLIWIYLNEFKLLQI
jgi:hypothetical protein